jgi:AraC-like DNA-binding protein
MSASSTIEFSATESFPGSPRASRLNYALQILEHASGDRAMEDAAAAVRMSPSRLRHLVKEQTGLSPTQFVRAARLKTARKLLVTSSLLVKQVMWEAGFSDISHFVRDYKKAFGETPSETRNHEFADIAVIDRAIPSTGSQLDREVEALGRFTSLAHMEQDATVFANAN